MIHPYTGDTTDIRPTERGNMSDLTALVECEKGPFFVKAMRNRPGGRRDSIVREKRINPFVQPVSPALRWHAEDEEWIALGFDLVDARPSNFKPGSPDLPSVVELLNRVGELDLPDVARDWPETRWDRFASNESEAELFQGDALLHADINPSNLLVGDQEVWAVDWAWPTRGAAFIDPAQLIVQLIAAGHCAEAAESWAAECKVWADADPKAIDAFATATVRMWRAMADRRPSEPWLAAVAAAAQVWADHRAAVRRRSASTE
ncbi:hypothetical protein [Streptomyces sp. TS71-3]|uniref:hypothetical protein n=1 Tax=Streptomyces sp. TS71-3 TaxID=2733862 RepID=UPI001BB41BCA|nr:hypothetical protein [Streptomyces sp. TS71-3]